jgi:hypothetical protein
VTRAPDQESRFEGNIGPGLVSLLLLGPLVLVGAVCVVVGFLWCFTGKVPG